MKDELIFENTKFDKPKLIELGFTKKIIFINMKRR